MQIFKLTSRRQVAGRDRDSCRGFPKFLQKSTSLLIIHSLFVVHLHQFSCCRPKIEMYISFINKCSFLKFSLSFHIVWTFIFSFCWIWRLENVFRSFYFCFEIPPKFEFSSLTLNLLLQTYCEINKCLVASATQFLWTKIFSTL